MKKKKKEKAWIFEYTFLGYGDSEAKARKDALARLAEEEIDLDDVKGKRAPAMDDVFEDE